MALHVHRVLDGKFPKLRLSNDPLADIISTIRNGMIVALYANNGTYRVFHLIAGVINPYHVKVVYINYSANTTLPEEQQWIATIHAEIPNVIELSDNESLKRVIMKVKDVPHKESFQLAPLYAQPSQKKGKLSTSTFIRTTVAKETYPSKTLKSRNPKKTSVSRFLKPPNAAEKPN